MAAPKIVVAVKQVKVAADDLEIVDGTVADDTVDRALNEWDAYATEEAIRVREACGGGEVVIVTVGDEESEEALRRCLAMGADRAVRVEGDGSDPIATAHALAGVVAAESPDLVLCGVQSSDSVQGATGTALAEFLGLPVAAVVKEVAWDGSGSARVHRELEGGLVDLVEIDTPALLTVQTGINEPRYATLRAIKQAEQVEIAVVAASPSLDSAYRVRRMYIPTRTGGAEMLDGDAASVAARILELIRERVA